MLFGLTDALSPFTVFDKDHAPFFFDCSVKKRQVIFRQCHIGNTFFEKISHYTHTFKK